MPDSLVNAAKLLGVVILGLVLIELLALPDWIARMLRGRMGRAEIAERIHAIESRLAELEKKSSLR